MKQARGLQVVAGVVIVATVVMAVAFTTRFGSNPALAPSPLVGRPAPAVSLPYLVESAMGTGFTIEDLQGQVVVVNFYASWCLECRNEHAALLATAEAFADLRVVFVAIPYQDSTQASIGFLDELGWSEVTLYAADPESRAAIAFGVRGVPETFFIDADGVVRGVIRGESTALLLGSTIDSLLRGETPGFQQGGGFQQGE